ncbi:unnamed protein product [Sphenostylis stenocarpa]|uniref:Uncharacterized protein n=1 Tax=Sphenostylis stenocarpa TaxID=92480 RepID=A0AA86SIX6_9FABA|nr:unnamed protein product [Sphenostylis stenocarpa]
MPTHSDPRSQQLLTHINWKQRKNKKAREGENKIKIRMRSNEEEEAKNPCEREKQKKMESKRKRACFAYVLPIHGNALSQFIHIAVISDLTNTFGNADLLKNKPE